MPLRDGFQQGEVPVRRGAQFRVVAVDHVVGQQLHARGIAARGEIFERADPDVTRSHSHDDSTRQHAIAHHRHARRNGGQCSRRRQTERVHGLADEVFAQHRPDGGTAVTATRKRRATGTFPLQVAALLPMIHDLAHQYRATIAELWHETAELMTGICHGQRQCTVGHGIARTDGRKSGVVQPFEVQAELIGKIVVENDECGFRDRRRRDARGKAFRQGCIGVGKLGKQTAILVECAAPATVQ